MVPTLKASQRYISKIIILAALLLIIATLIGAFNLNRVAGATSVIYDKQFVNALRDVSEFIPVDEVIVTSTNAPFVLFFTDRPVKIPIGVQSKEALVRYMLERKYRYLLVFEGDSQVPELSGLFSSSGLPGLKDSFSELEHIQTDSSSIHLYELSAGSAESAAPASWSTYTVSDINDVGSPVLSEINTIQIRVVDNGNGPVSIWLGKMSLVDTETQTETVIEEFGSGHGYIKQNLSGIQEDDVSDSVSGSQSLLLTTDGDGEPVFTRKSGISDAIDFTGKTVKLWVKISDPSKLLNMRVTVTNDEFENYRNFWILR